jgi:2-desacetyl-2-hydroxyethyl bacteriochlorophyllide A dehydrogenase
MQAVICDHPGALTVVDRPAPIRSGDDVLVAIKRVGLCGTDYHIFGGNQPYLEYPRIMGHELAGEVLEVREGSALHIGQLVTINPYLPCGECGACRKARPNCCSNIKVLGVHTDGGLREQILVPESAVIDATGLSPDQAAMVEFLAIGAHAVSRAKVSEGDKTLVVGAGPIGIAVALFAGLNGADVTIVDRREARLRYASESLGINDTMLVSDDMEAKLRAATDGAMFDQVFDATGHIEAMSNGLSYVAHAGTYTLVGVTNGDLRFADPEFHKRETTLLASRNALAGDFSRVIAAIKDGSIPSAALHTQAIVASDLPDAMPELIAKADHVLKAIVRF